MSLIARHLDLAVLALALPVFVIADLPLEAWLATSAAWLIQAAIATAMMRRAVASGRRQDAVAVLAGSIVARLWLVTGAALLVGLLGSDDAGLAAAIFAAALVTAHLISETATRLHGAGSDPVGSDPKGTETDPVGSDPKGTETGA